LLASMVINLSAQSANAGESAASAATKAYLAVCAYNSLLFANLIAFAMTADSQRQFEASQGASIPSGFSDEKKVYIRSLISLAWQSKNKSLVSETMEMYQSCADSAP
jgi:hypothetical protein